MTNDDLHGQPFEDHEGSLGPPKDMTYRSDMTWSEREQIHLAEQRAAQRASYRAQMRAKHLTAGIMGGIIAGAIGMLLDLPGRWEWITGGLLGLALYLVVTGPWRRA